MTDNEGPSVLIQRLHELRISRGMTIQQMAELCGIPKSSMESYMRMTGAKRPGIDALIAIADGLEVSIDWLVGRAVDNMPQSLGQRDYALRCFAVFQEFIAWMHEKQRHSTNCIVTESKIGGIDDGELAAKSMILFLDGLRQYSESHRTPEGRASAWDFFDRVEGAIRDRQPATD